MTDCTPIHAIAEGQSSDINVIVAKSMSTLDDIECFESLLEAKQNEEEERLELAALWKSQRNEEDKNVIIRGIQKLEKQEDLENVFLRFE